MNKKTLSIILALGLIMAGCGRAESPGRGQNQEFPPTQSENPGGKVEKGGRDWAGQDLIYVAAMFTNEVLVLDPISGTVLLTEFR